MSGHVPTVFVSSTFFGLEAIRFDLSKFFENELGYRTLLFEHSSFPVESDADTVENCRRRVQEDADAFILIIGDRYGYVPPEGHLSVTNIEYLAARAKGIPIYSFITSEALAHFENRQNIPDLSPETSALFDFIAQVRSNDSAWMFPFVTSHDITRTLRVQFAYQMTRGLLLQQRIRAAEPVLIGLSGKALRLALEKPMGWGGLLFAQILIDEVFQMKDLIRAYRAEVAFGPGESVADNQITEWLHSRFADAIRHAQGMNTLLSETLNASFNSGDATSIVSHARLLSLALQEIVEWAQRIRRTHVNEDWEPVKSVVAKMCDNIVTELEKFGPTVREAIEKTLADTEGPETRTLQLTLVLTIAYVDEYNKELAILKKKRRWF